LCEGSAQRLHALIEPATGQAGPNPDKPVQNVLQV
jgi:hypothetical protein